MACRFEQAGHSLDGKPIDIVITSEASGAAFQNIGDPDLQPTVWSPAATSWVNMLRQVHEDWVPLPADISSIAKSPQVIAMPRTIGVNLNWPVGSLGWSDVVNYATVPGAWDAISEPGWGSFNTFRTSRIRRDGRGFVARSFRRRNP